MRDSRVQYVTKREQEQTLVCVGELYTGPSSPIRITFITFAVSVSGRNICEKMTGLSDTWWWWYMLCYIHTHVESISRGKRLVA